MLYAWKVRLLKTRRGHQFWRYWRARRGDELGDYSRLPEYIRKYAPGRSFVDIGCMWGVNGEHSFIAEQAGASSVTGVDLYGPTVEFEEKKRARNSSVQFMLGDVSNAETVARIGVVDVVFCAGVLYHHPSPFDVLIGLRRICGRTLILRTSTIPENRRLPNMAIYYPMLEPDDRQLWNLTGSHLGRQIGITGGYEPGEGYGNWFWGLTPSCLVSLLTTAGFKVEYRATEAFAQTVICTPGDLPAIYNLPGSDHR
jgi:SAM-dependent methyltransferase